MSHMMPLPN
ncbi:Uncharacterized protein HZ326_14396, partial [Fusarium oxysporum f. sp. albedinis]